MKSPSIGISAREVNVALSHTRLGGHVHHFSEVPSTNDLALEAGMRGQPFGVWVADAQTAGRGRGGHTWHSPPGDGLYVSALFTPRLPPSAGDLSLAAGVAVWEAVREVSGLVTDIRWPNDLVTRPPAGTGPSKKLGGILAETAASPVDPLSHRPSAPPSSRPSSPPSSPPSAATLRYAVIGIGINVAHTSFPPEIAARASSLRLEGWENPSRQRLLVSLLHRLDMYILNLEEGYAGREKGPGVLARLAEASTWLHGKRVSVPEDGGYTGTTAGLDPNGFLLVDGDDGQRHTVRSGGVREMEDGEIEDGEIENGP